MSYLWCHPVWCSDERVSSSDGSVQLSTNSKVDKLDLGIVREENVLTLDITMDNLASVQMSQTSKNLTENKRKYVKKHLSSIAKRG